MDVSVTKATLAMGELASHLQMPAATLSAIVITMQTALSIGPLLHIVANVVQDSKATGYLSATNSNRVAEFSTIAGNIPNAEN